MSDLPQLNSWATYGRYLVAFVSIAVLCSGVGLQIFSASNLYNVPLHLYCQAYSGSPDLSTAVSMRELINTALSRRQYCLSMAGEQRDVCCARIGGYTGLCARPEEKLPGTIKSNGTLASAQSKMVLLTTLLGQFFGVSSASQYNSANAEFWCKNCPNDLRKNCPFQPSDSSHDITDSQLCNCPGGTVSKRGQAFWATLGDPALAADFILCSDKAQVYRAWLQALFPEFSTVHLDDASSRFWTKCVQGRAVVGYVLVIGPSLAVIAAALSILSFFKYFANSPVPIIGFHSNMLSITLTFIAFWPLSFTGAASLISRYTFCAHLQYPMVINGSAPLSGARAAPTFYNGSPCYDLNSEGVEAPNPFVQQLGMFNAGYVTGGVLAIIAQVALMAVVSKHSDVIFELKLAGRISVKKPQ